MYGWSRTGRLAVRVEDRSTVCRSPPGGTRPHQCRAACPTTTPTPEGIKACCAAAYGSDLAALLLGDSYHPGGLALTRRLARQPDLPPDAHVLDVAAGRGATARVQGSEFGLRVSGVDLSAANVALAEGTAAADGLTARVSFEMADAERLPHADASFDAVVVECALCTFPDKPAAPFEIARVLRGGGKLGLTDVVAEANRLPAALTTFAAHLACIAGALPLHTYAGLVEAAGLSVTRTERHDTAIMRMIDQIDARLTLVRLTAPAQIEALGLDIHRAGPALPAARAAVADGILGYGLLVARNRDRTVCAVIERSPALTRALAATSPEEEGFSWHRPVQLQQLVRYP